MKKISVFLCSILLSSCIAVGSESIRNIDTVRENMSYYGLNKQSIESMFGMPASSFERDGKNVYEYNYIAVYNNPASYIPLIGLLFDPNKYTANYLYVTFDKFVNVETYEALSDTGDFPPQKIF